MQKRIQEIKEQRAKLVQENRALLDKAVNEKRELTTEEQQQYDARFQMVEQATASLERMEKQLATEKRLAEPVPPKAAPAAPSEPGGSRTRTLSEEELRLWGERATPEYRTEFREFLLSGRVGTTIQKYYEKRDLAAGPAVSGGYLVVPQEFIAELIKFVDDEVFLRKLARKFTVMSAESLGAPSLDTDVSDADWTPEITAVQADTSLAFGKRELRPQQLTKLIKVSNKLMRQAAIGPEQIVRDRLAYKFGVTQEKAFLTGSGAQQPLGVFTASAQGISTSRDVNTDNTTTAPTLDGLKNAKYALKPAYWPRARWIFHRDAVKILAKIKDGEGRYIWEPSVVSGEPDRLLNFPLHMSEFAPNTFTTGLYVGILGDFSHYWIADSLAMDVQRLVELYAATNQTGFIGRLETDGMPVLEEAFVRVKLA